MGAQRDSQGLSRAPMFSAVLSGAQGPPQGSTASSPFTIVSVNLGAVSRFSVELGPIPRVTVALRAFPQGLVGLRAFPGVQVAFMAFHKFSVWPMALQCRTWVYDLPQNFSGAGNQCLGLIGTQQLAPGDSGT